MKVLYLPLDERPCNYLYPSMIAGQVDNIQLVVPDKSLLGEKKRPANLDNLWAWLEKEIPACNAAVISIETAVYGGLLPSRIHHMSLEECLKQLDRLKRLRAINPGMKLYVSALVMRTPTYSSSDEEPDYYQEYGSRIFKYGRLTDKSSRGLITPDEDAELETIKKEVPAEYITDYINRRKVNLEVNKEVVKLVKEGIIDFLSIPQDDCQPYGFTPLDQKEIIEVINKDRLQNRVYIYPGADEVGCTLVSRAFNESMGRRPLVYVGYSSVIGSQIVPLFEDRPIAESIKSHVLAAGGLLVDTPEEADLILMVNTPGKVIQECQDFPTKDITYSSFRNLREFVERLGRYIMLGKKCILGDVAFINGGDTELINMLDEARLLDKLYGYAGWNTVCNTLGTVISTGLVGYDSSNEKARAYNLIFRVMEDWCYQMVVRESISQNEIQTINGGAMKLDVNEETIKQLIIKQLNEVWDKEIRSSFKQWEIKLDSIYMPWHRMFEVGLNLDIEKKQ